MTPVQIILTIVAAVVLTAVVSVMLTSRRMRRKVAYMLDALEDKELNFRFDEKRLRDRRFNRTLNRLRNIFDKERKEILEQEQYYGLMLDHVRTGVAVIEADGRVNWCNKTALSMLGIATFSHIRQLRAVSESLYEAFSKVTGMNEERASFFNEAGKKTIALTASGAKIGGKNVKVVAFNDISDEMADNEQESWTRLIRVLTHEIMNTVTPIASLSETLYKYLDKESSEYSPELLTGLETISQSSRGLIRFVESYRNLTRVAAPSKKAFALKELIDRVFQLTGRQTAGVTCTYVEKSDDILLYADENQISQILVNLLKNACQAGADKIEITAEIDISENIIINVANNGRPISKESQEEIFVPFYTTKQDGTGIGLSLSRQIMRLHNGSLRLSRSDEKSTVFTLQFK
ncbi:MAG: PAS domain-containing protein [Bacteroidales bacterium]|nr:PAS domain-containing protein [Bacteroidales bacterium]